MNVTGVVLEIPRATIGTDAVGASVVIAEGTPLFEEIRKLVLSSSGSEVTLGGPQRQVLETASAVTLEEPNEVIDTEVKVSIDTEKIAAAHHMDIAPADKPAPPSMPYEDNL